MAQTFDPVTGDGACAAVPATDQAGTATYRGQPVPASGFTLLGSATLVADITSRGATSQIAARLLDVDPGPDTETLVARGLWRPLVASGPVQQVFQLHPNGYRFAPGHVVKLELLPNDHPSYGQVSNGQAEIRISNARLRLPVLEAPGSLGGLVQSPAAKVLPPGFALAADFLVSGYPRPKGATPVHVALVPAFSECMAPGRTHGAPLSFGSCAPPVRRSQPVTIGTPEANGRALPRSASSICGPSRTIRTRLARRATCGWPRRSRTCDVTATSATTPASSKAGSWCASPIAVAAAPRWKPQRSWTRRCAPRSAAPRRPRPTRARPARP